MSDVQFDEQDLASYTQPRKIGEKSTLVKFVEKMGVPEEYVNYVFIGVVSVCIFFAVLIVIR